MTPDERSEMFRKWYAAYDAGQSILNRPGTLQETFAEWGRWRHSRSGIGVELMGLAIDISYQCMAYERRNGFPPWRPSRALRESAK